MEQPHLAGLETTFTAVNWSGRLRVRSGVDGGVQNAGVKRYRNLSSRHLTTVAAEPRDHDLVLLVAETSQSHVRIAVAARNRIVRDNPTGEAEWSVVQGRTMWPTSLRSTSPPASSWPSRRSLRSIPAGPEPCQNRRRRPSANLARPEASTCCWNVMCWRGHIFGSTFMSTSPMAIGSATRHCKPSASTCFTSSKPCRRTASTWMRACRRAGYTARHTGATCSGTSSSFFPFSRSAHPPSPEPHCAIGIGDYLRHVKPPGKQDSRRHVSLAVGKRWEARRASGCTSTRCPAAGHWTSAICSGTSATQWLTPHGSTSRLPVTSRSSSTTVPR
jgi:hypothetical protein